LGKMVGQETEFEEMRDISRLFSMPESGMPLFQKTAYFIRLEDSSR
jgi:hypothetical protein